jgi:hypothetical protein
MNCIHIVNNKQVRNVTSGEQLGYKIVHGICGGIFCKYNISALANLNKATSFSALKFSYALRCRILRGISLSLLDWIYPTSMLVCCENVLSFLNVCFSCMMHSDCN